MQRRKKIYTPNPASRRVTSTSSRFHNNPKSCSSKVHEAFTYYTLASAVYISLSLNLAHQKREEEAAAAATAAAPRNYGSCHGCSFVDGVFAPRGGCPNHEPRKLQQRTHHARLSLSFSSRLYSSPTPLSLIDPPTPLQQRTSSWLLLFSDAAFYIYLYLSFSRLCRASCGLCVRGVENPPLFDQATTYTTCTCRASRY